MTIRKTVTVVAMLLLSAAPLYAQGGGTPPASGELRVKTPIYQDIRT
jgi:hypothetical protein